MIKWWKRYKTEFCECEKYLTNSSYIGFDCNLRCGSCGKMCPPPPKKRHFYWASYHIKKSDTEFGFGGCDVDVDSPIDSAECIIEMSKIIGEKLGIGQVVIMNLIKLREE